MDPYIEGLNLDTFFSRVYPDTQGLCNDESNTFPFLARIDLDNRPLNRIQVLVLA